MNNAELTERNSFNSRRSANFVLLKYIFMFHEAEITEAQLVVPIFPIDPTVTSNKIVCISTRIMFSYFPLGY